MRSKWLQCAALNDFIPRKAFVTNSHSLVNLCTSVVFLLQYWSPTGWRWQWSSLNQVFGLSDFGLSIYSCLFCLCSFETKFCLVYFGNLVSTKYKQCVGPQLRLASLDNLTMGRPPRPPRSPRQAREGDRVFDVWLSPTHHIGCVIHTSTSKHFWHKDCINGGVDNR